MIRKAPRITGGMFAIAVLLGLSMPFKSPGQGASKTPPKQPTPRSTSNPFRPTNPHIKLVRIPPGSFMMGATDGAEDERPVHEVTISYSFHIGKYEVTPARWLAVMGNNPSNFKHCGNCPVEQVSWDDAQIFIREMNKLSDGYTYRLPTEAEWEYASRAGASGDYVGLSEI
jgi:formylglycine-generating enzyme required for sulfatase activity